jgi:hypothetical protein
VGVFATDNPIKDEFYPRLYHLFKMILSILIVTIIAAPIEKRMLMCSATCHENDFTHLFTETAGEYAANCLKNMEIGNPSLASKVLYLDSINGSCTNEIYDAVEQVVNLLKDPSFIAIPCRAQCNGNSSNLSDEAQSDCYSTMSPGIFVETQQEAYDRFNEVYQIMGQCTFRQYNQRENILRRNLLEPKNVPLLV